MTDAVCPDTKSGKAPAASRRRTLARPLALAGLCVLAAAGLLFAAARLSAPAEPTAVTPAPALALAGGAFLPTPQQWAGLRLQQVSASAFTPLVHTEGRIALDDDLNTPFFSPYSGRVTQVMARLGDAVHVGTPLFAVQSTELAQAQSDMIGGLAGLRTARAQLQLAVLNERRQHTLYLGHGAAQRDWQQSLVDLATAQGNLSSAAIAVTAVRNRMAILGLDRAAIQAIETSRNPGRVSADTVVRAPVAGTITQRQISTGQNIVGSVASQGASPAVFTIGNLGRVWMVASASEADAPRLRPGEAASVRVPAYPDRRFDARIAWLAPVIGPATHRLLVRAEVANPDGALKPDMLAQFEIVTGGPATALAVPAAAVVYEGADAHVWVADPAQHTLALRAVRTGALQTGPSDGAMVQILDGLHAGEHVVTSGAVFIDRTLSGN